MIARSIPVLSFFFASAAFAAPATVYESAGQKFAVENLLQRDDVIWGFDFLANDKIVFTERSGKIGIHDLSAKTTVMLTGAPTVWAKGQGGMLDVRVHPRDKTKIYFTYSEPVGDGATTALGRATISGTALTGFERLFSADAANKNQIHFGSRVEFDQQGKKVFVTIGDRNDRPRVQDLGAHNGKIVRLNDDGTIPRDNPFYDKQGAKKEIWTLGHRSPQGLVMHPTTGELWMAEMGPRGGDEVNLIKKGLNYGWPVITYGREYHGPAIGEGTEKPGMEQPVVYWAPSISPSGITIYNGNKFPKWQGDMFIGNLSGQHLRRLVLEGNRVVSQEELLKDRDLRVRSVRPGPDGFLYLSTDDGQIVRLVPAR